MASGNVRVISLGGVGEVGKNCTVVEFGDDLVVVDVGVMFPEEEMHGIDLVIPDFTYIKENKHRLKGILLTHGHEDHIGALPYLLSQLEGTFPVYGSRLTLGLARVKLNEHRVLEKADLRVVEEGEHVALGAMDVEMVRVSHSIPDSRLVVLHTPAGSIVDTGDFKFDGGQTGGSTDIEKLAELGDRGVLALLSDCVRVEEAGYTPPESVVAEAMDRIVRGASGRVLLSTFASNITRVQQMIHIAHRYGRKVAVVGRSMEENLRVAREIGYLDIPNDSLTSVEETRKLSPNQIVFIVTGAQGEPTSVLSRIAAGDHPHLSVVPGDTIMVAATPIPGNEETVARTIDNLFRQGAAVIYEAIAPDVHVSGHASREDLKYMLSLLKPTFCMPIHGEFRHLVLYRALAEEMGIDASRVFLAEIGQIMEFGRDRAGSVGRVTSGSVLVDGLMVGGVTKAVLRERGRLAEDGVVIASLAIDRETGSIVGGPDIVSVGFVHPDGAGVFDEAKGRLVRSLKRQRRGQIEYGYAVSKVKDVLGSYIYNKTRRRPMILPVVTEV